MPLLNPADLEKKRPTRVDDRQPYVTNYPMEFTKLSDHASAD
jgi:hypothetical protein